MTIMIVFKRHENIIYIYIFFFWPCCAACRILVPRPGIEPAPLAVKAWNPNYWTAREFPKIYFKATF